jgi:hypothetical protein
MRTASYEDRAAVDGDDRAARLAAVVVVGSNWVLDGAGALAWGRQPSLCSQRLADNGMQPGGSDLGPTDELSAGGRR